ncbi:MAG: DUF2062 domain-containing protein [Sumerlaeia bacterium]
MRTQKATTREISQGAALGIFLAFAAPPGLQLIPGLLIASLMGASRVATALGVFVSNPLTMPLIYPASYRLGSWVTGYFLPVRVPDETEEIWQAAINESTPQFLLVNMWVGLLLLGSIFGILAYYTAGWAFERYVKKRQAQPAA